MNVNKAKTYAFISRHKQASIAFAVVAVIAAGQIFKYLIRDKTREDHNAFVNTLGPLVKPRFFQFNKQPASQLCAPPCKFSSLHTEYPSTSLPGDTPIVGPIRPLAGVSSFNSYTAPGIKMSYSQDVMNAEEFHSDDGRLRRSGDKAFASDALARTAKISYLRSYNIFTIGDYPRAGPLSSLQASIFSQFPLNAQQQAVCLSQRVPASTGYGAQQTRIKIADDIDCIMRRYYEGEAWNYNLSVYYKIIRPVTAAAP